ncbi:MAG: hypothetical protein HOO09_00455 [Rhodospirillaceae bacterium]|jgi:hypothetical protein|nr:hypothetical protein [Rhodospirillaceae bacterium]MBT5239732.1 hypothetical protein [Rhodospirillaceae bacterium]MBT5567238.1 hypothetical protein [Rhodospirillaceae bacterium]MBT6960743.1 hypothetical protein [Rhodospirillaceae bacterium]
MTPRTLKTVLLLAPLLTLTAPSNDAYAEPQTLGFVVTKWNTAMHETRFMDECPEGPTPGNWEIWESTVTPEERRSYPEALITQVRHVNYRGPNGEDICAEPTSVVDPPLKIVEGKYSYGIDLDNNEDGQATPKTCTHKNFAGLNGENGIDNQMYRLMGCVEAWRSYGHIESNANSHRVSSGLGMILMEVTGVDDLLNDDSVKVIFYRGVGSFTLDSKGEVLPFASYEIDHENGEPRYNDMVSGKIVDGVLKTVAADVHIPHYGNYQYLRQLIQDMQVDMELPTESGKTSGMVYGYYGVEQFYSYVRGMLTSFPNRHKFSCPPIYVAAHELADGHPDPESGECTTLSSAFKFNAVRAFINHPEPEKLASTSDSSGALAINRR